MFHAIITRVSLRRPDTPEPDRNGLSAKLYDQICRASLKQQINKNFVSFSAWGIRGDGYNIDNEYQIVAPDIQDQFHHAGELFACKILDTTADNKILVTRIDSDDALHNTFVDRLQQIAVKHPNAKIPFYFDVASIWQVDHNSKSIRRKSFKPGYISPFVSVMCDRNNLTGVLKKMMIKHTSTGEVTVGGNRFEQLDVLQTIHTKNIRNKRCGNIVSTKLTIRDFIGNDIVHIK